MKSGGFSILCFVLLALFSSVGFVDAMTSTNYEIRFDSITAGGDDTSSSSTYLLRDSVGETGSSNATSTTYQSDGGYRAGIYDRVADFDIHIQNRGSQVAASSLSSTTVTVTSVTGYATGDYIVIVQNEGASQSSAIGKIASVGSSTLTVDVLSGDSLTIDGNNDYVYELTGTTLSFGTLSSSTVTTSIVGWEVSADVDDGYSVYVVVEGELTSGTDTIWGVTDGEVTAGSSEYGARSSDTSLTSSTFDTEDTAFTTDLAQVASRNDNSFESRDHLTIKTAVSSGLSDGTYTQTMALIYVGDY